MTQDLMVIDNDFMPALSVPQAIQRFNTLVEFVQHVMREGVDYGKVPNTDKNTLMKAGAEKLTTLFGMTVRFEIVEQVQDWTGDQHGGEPFFYYWYRCSLWRGGLLITEADGSCNSRESKYRWRESKRKCPQCGMPAIIKGKAEYGGGWLCFKKQGGCGAKYSEGASEIEGQPTGRVANPDICDLVNTIQKMGQKRALVAATLIGCNASEFFTQDVEDLPLAGDGASYVPPAQPIPPASPANPVTGEVIDQPASTPPPATPKQRNYIAALQDDLGWHSEAMAQFAKDQNVDLISMTSAQASALIEAMKQEAERPAPAPNGERPLVTRLREIVGECRAAGVAVPSLPKPRIMTDEQLIEVIDKLEIELSVAAVVAGPSDDDLFGEPAGHVSDSAELPL